MTNFFRLATHTVFGVALVLLQTSWSHAGVIGGVTVHSVSSELSSSYGIDMGAHTIVDGGGLNAAGQHDNVFVSGSHWETDPYQYSAWIVFDLGNTYDVDAMRLWNFNATNQNGSYTGRGVQRMKVYTSTDLNAWTQRGDTWTLTIAPGTPDYVGDLYTWLAATWTGVRYIKFDEMSYFGIGDVGGHVGLSELRFYQPEAAVSQDPVPAPEPGTLALLGLGLGLSRLRRRR
jgi:hypothetical protein